MYLHSNKSRIRIIQQRLALNKWSVFKAKFSPLDKAEVNLINNLVNSIFQLSWSFHNRNLESEAVNLHSDIYLFIQTILLLHSNVCESIWKGITKTSNKWPVWIQLLSTWQHLHMAVMVQGAPVLGSLIK